jgi:hypothetical protein
MDRRPAKVAAVALANKIARDNEMFVAAHESVFGTKRTLNCRPAISAFGGKADITQTSENVRF